MRIKRGVSSHSSKPDHFSIETHQGRVPPHYSIGKYHFRIYKLGQRQEGNTDKIRKVESSWNSNKLFFLSWFLNFQSNLIKSRHLPAFHHPQEMGKSRVPETPQGPQGEPIVPGSPVPAPAINCLAASGISEACRGSVTSTFTWLRGDLLDKDRTVGSYIVIILVHHIWWLI